MSLTREMRLSIVSLVHRHDRPVEELVARAQAIEAWVLEGTPATGPQPTPEGDAPASGSRNRPRNAGKPGKPETETETAQQGGA